MTINLGDTLPDFNLTYKKNTPTIIIIITRRVNKTPVLKGVNILQPLTLYSLHVLKYGQTYSN